MQIKINSKLHVGEIAEICDLYGEDGQGAAKNELARLFNVSPTTIRRILKKHLKQWQKTGFKEYLEE